MATKIYGSPMGSYSSGIYIQPYVILDDESVEYTGDAATYIPYVTDIEYSAEITTDSGVIVDSVKVVCGSQHETTADGVGSFTNVNSNKITFTAYAFAGSVTHTITLPRVEYIKPTCSLEVSMTTDGTATLNIEGNYFNDTFGAIDNDLTVQYRYKEVGGSYSSWKTVTPDLSSDSYSASVEIDLDYQTAYTFQARATDEFFTDTDSSSGKSTPVFDWSKSDFNFNVPVTPNGSIYLNGQKSMICCGEPGDTTDPYQRAIIDVTQHGYLEINGGNYYADEPQGTTNIYGYDGISLVCDGTTRIGGKNGITLSTDGDIDLFTEPAEGSYVYINGEELDFESGTWSPRAYSFSRDEYEGNFVRFGDICVVSFFLEGDATATDDMFTIYNLPYAPDGTRWWAGGGNLTRHYANNGYVFCGWVVEADGDVYARTNAVSTADGQNRTSNYAGQNSGQTIIASGTIMYRIDPTELE